MDTQPKATLTQQEAGPALGQYGELVFDDEPLAPLLAGTAPAAPTPANVLEIWRQGDRSENCVRALMAVLARGNQRIPLVDRLAGGNQCPPVVGNLEAAEECLRELIRSKLAKTDLDHAGCCFALARLLVIKEQFEGAEAFFRQALTIQERCLGENDNLPLTTAGELVKLLAKTNRPAEATRLRNIVRARKLVGKDDSSSLWDVRQVALDMFVAGQYAEAEVIYRRLLAMRFSPASTHCHLARIFLMTGREPEAQQEVDEAWRLRDETPIYAIARTQFLRVLLPMLWGEDWKPRLLELKDVLSKPDVHMEWTMLPVVDHLKPRLGEEWHTMLTAIIAAISSRCKLTGLEANPTWRLVCRIEEPAPKIETTASPPPEAAPAIPEQAEFVSLTEKPGDEPLDGTPDSQSETTVEVDKFTFGTVVKVGGNCVTIREYNFARDADEEVEYRVNDRTEFGNVTKADELKPGDSVVVDFTESGGHNLISILVKEENHEPSAGNSEPEQPLHPTDPSLDDSCNP